MMADETPCYAAYCRTCGGMIAVAVAPVEIPRVLQDAIRSRRQWERQGFRIGVVAVKDIHGGALTGHADTCEAKPRQKPKHRKPRSVFDAADAGLFTEESQSKWVRQEP